MHGHAVRLLLNRFSHSARIGNHGHRREAHLVDGSVAPGHVPGFLVGHEAPDPRHIPRGSCRRARCGSPRRFVQQPPGVEVPARDIDDDHLVGCPGAERSPCRRNRVRACVEAPRTGFRRRARDRTRSRTACRRGRRSHRRSRRSPARTRRAGTWRACRTWPRCHPEPAPIAQGAALRGCRALRRG